MNENEPRMRDEDQDGVEKVGKHTQVGKVSTVSKCEEGILNRPEGIFTTLDLNVELVLSR